MDDTGVETTSSGNDATAVGGETLNQLYRKVYLAYNKFEDAPELQRDEEVFYDLLEQITTVMDRASAEGLVSANEHIEDTSTNSLKYLFLPYYYARVCAKCPDFNRRLHYLTVSNGYLNAFMERCVKVGVLREEEVEPASLDADRTKLSDADRRQRKIDKFKQEKASKQRIEFLKKFIAESENDPDGFDVDVEARELYILELQQAGRAAVDELLMNNQEIKMIEHRMELEQHESDLSASDSRMKKRESTESGSGSIPSPYPSGGDPSNEGLSVTRMLKVGDQIVMTKETIKASVFQPRMAPPSMTLEEFADLEVKAALEREESAKNNPNPVTRRYKQLEGDGEEENLDLVDQATLKDREWDLFKEDNPRGWGNKMGKRY